MARCLGVAVGGMGASSVMMRSHELVYKYQLALGEREHLVRRLYNIDLMK